MFYMLTTECILTLNSPSRPQGPFTRMPEHLRVLISRMLCVNPAQRITAQEAKDVLEVFYSPRPPTAPFATPAPLAQGNDNTTAEQEQPKRSEASQEGKRTPGYGNAHADSDPPPLSPFPNVTSCEFEWLAAAPVPTPTANENMVELRPAHINSTSA